ncbi:uncharacterized protein ASCRUDRAFT_77566 [Ascoidea rubescens DSM 1968]|uniref:Uncharacterized protein n=1 Tax=Ascoidea rubescens DSM 1968 TaxID=1344418 RepID=A0A1D2VB64_9ASCO|nr:hypothetical protein ASCRUDRAFT_77566 [Ascoidea rubescens DSM 1968]ODV58835.1 hypothetical protein ASCRUDRAFT_77566 [Ascoidea rubescens DSM 1968]
MQSSITKGEPSFCKISTISIGLLSKIPDYVLDYNIFFFKGVKKFRDEDSKSSSSPAINEIKRLICKNSVDNCENINYNLDEKTKTCIMHDRLLTYLVLERKRRDKFLLKMYLDSQLNKDKSKSKNQKKSIEEIEKEFSEIKLLDEEHLNIDNYKIRSPIYNYILNNEDDLFKNRVSFRKFSILQRIEYNFEEELNDDDLIENFCDCDDFDFFRKFKLSGNEEYDYKDMTQEDIEKREKKYDEVINEMMDKDIIRILIPLASQVILSGIDLNKGHTDISFTEVEPEKTSTVL